jgi:hypothetical protein
VSEESLLRKFSQFKDGAKLDCGAMIAMQVDEGADEE